MAKVTDQGQIPDIADGDKWHIVDVSDTTDDPAGSSFYTTPLQAKSYFNQFQASSLSDDDASYMYFGDVSWRIRRVLRTDGTALEADMANNGGYGTLAAAWPDRATLTYS